MRTILIANRGEIACRVIRTAHAMGYNTVAVYSEADRDALHVRLADAATCIGEAPASESYLNPQRVIEAARRAGADAIHPGYGFLSENAAFARACADAGLTFIGPPADAVDLMGDKIRAKRAMIEAGIPCVPGYHAAADDPDGGSDARLVAEAERVGYPLLVKAAAGGGGRGMRLVEGPEGLTAAIAAARAEAESAFGDGALLLERAVRGARHVEIQVFGDGHGNVVHLGERDCSVQRRHQKVVEEAPSPAVDPKLRARMGTAAVKAAKAIGYTSAGTVEFLVGDDGAFYFLEMNTRLQVEHPVTELVTGYDLVAWQLMVAEGETLPVQQKDILLRGHAIEVRLYAEDPHAGFLPRGGDPVHAWIPADGDGVRVDHGLCAGQVLSPHYDPMIAKLIARGGTRDEARRRLARALRRTVLLGPVTNRRFLIDVLEHPVFAAGDATTTFVQDVLVAEGALAPDKAPTPSASAWAAAALLLTTADGDPHVARDGWRTSADVLGFPLELRCGEQTATLSVRPEGHAEVTITGVPGADGAVGARLRERDGADAGGTLHHRLEVLGVERTWTALRDGDGALHLNEDGAVHVFTEVVPRGADADDGAAGGRDGIVRAPSVGRVTDVRVAAGAEVAAGEALVVLEAMKIQTTLTAGVAGTVAEVTVAVGDQVAARDVLVRVTPRESNESNE